MFECSSMWFSSSFLAGSKVRCDRYGLTNQPPYWVSEIRLSVGGDGGEVRRADFGPTSLALLLRHRLQLLGLSLFSRGKHEDWFCPLGHALAQETADGCGAAVGLLLPWPGWVCMFTCVSTGNIWKWRRMNGMVVFMQYKSTVTLRFCTVGVQTCWSRCSSVKCKWIWEVENCCHGWHEVDVQKREPSRTWPEQSTPAHNVCFRLSCVFFKTCYFICQQTDVWWTHQSGFVWLRKTEAFNHVSMTSCKWFELVGGVSCAVSLS